MVVVVEDVTKTLTFCSLLTRCTIPCACHAKRHLNFQKWREHVVFCTCVEFEMCFAPQRRALFRHLNLQSGPNMVCFVHFHFETCFAPQRRACLISHLASWLPRRFSEPTFRPSGATNRSWGKHSVSRLSYLFAHLHLLSSDSLSSTLLSSNLSLLSASALLCFSSAHIVGSLTSKLPSIIVIVYAHAEAAEAVCLICTHITYRERERLS